MKNFFSRKSLSVAAIVAAAGLALSGCGGGGTAGGGSSDAAGPAFDVAKTVALTGSPTYDKVKSAGAIRIGVKEDQPGLGYLDAATGERTGFDIEIATWMAASLGIAKDKIQFKAIPSANRETALANGDVDLYVGTYSITDKRKKIVDFAGPYFITGQGLLVQKANTTINSEKDLDGKKVCSATGSTPIQNIRQNFPKAIPVEFDLYSKCVENLKNGSVDAVTTDQAILLGFASSQDGLKVVGQPFTVEKYGVGLAKGDTALRTFLNKTLTDGGATWTKIYKDTLGKSGTTVEQPKVDQY
ncbi:glutamate transport system substrate-binding protein [Arthrobacter silviterrae]|uniref:Glutamate ABC transporter substrate-binding protein n=1 Tax=Arthrobacter silviterrae TaxID=2026658 RepID=A0ABX0DF96_9MICC|nr:MULTISPECIES: glutamate ABC transporter substrate-binding protein [Arthrobacter]MCU6479398.1 glutamate ABC transporter substrate-binding protein [Arthrobacter sp. A2-55]MDQ0277251.1 glutamate transport system substrate-binding protein [Arthrobacter silviterrae]NGN82862.1 glutamate ABC transporter substrate-binding protein [Arthrobacter silviterrae]